MNIGGVVMSVGRLLLESVPLALRRFTIFIGGLTV